MKIFKVVCLVLAILASSWTPAVAQATARPDRPVYVDPSIQSTGSDSVPEGMLYRRVVLNIKNHQWLLVHPREVGQADQPYDRVYLSASYSVSRVERGSSYDSSSWRNYTGSSYGSDTDVVQYMAHLTVDADYVRNGVTLFTATSGEVVMTTSQARTSYSSSYSSCRGSSSYSSYSDQEDQGSVLEQMIINEAAYRLMVNMNMFARERFARAEPSFVPPAETGSVSVPSAEAWHWSAEYNMPTNEVRLATRSGVQLYCWQGGTRYPAMVRVIEPGRTLTVVKIGTPLSAPIFNPRQGKITYREP